LAHLEPEDFLEMTQRVNNTIRGGDSNVTQSLDGEYVRLASHDVPAQQDKEQLMLETWQGVQTILKDQSLSTEEALRYSALLAGGGIALIHPFIDSNGRTSRTMARVIDGGTDESFESDMQKVLSSKGSDYFQLTAPNAPYYTEMAVPHRMPNEKKRSLQGVKEVNFAPDSKNDDDFFFDDEDIINDTGVLEDLVKKKFKYEVLGDFAKLVDEEGWEVIQKHVDDDKVLHFGDALRELSEGDKGIQYMAQIRELERNARADFIRRFIASMTTDKKVELSFSDNRAMERVQEGISEDAQRRYGEELIKHSSNEGTIQPRQAYDALHTAYSSKHNPDEE
jgi:hypothetical protein